MMFPDCRNDENYNEDFLNGVDKEFVAGYDWCTEQAVDNFFDNLDVYFSDDSSLIKAFNEELPEVMQSEEEIEWTFGNREPEVRKIRTFGDLFRFYLHEWIESERDELITSMIDNMDDDLYKAIKHKVLVENENKSESDKKEYYDTRKYACTGKKVTNRDDDCDD